MAENAIILAGGFGTRLRPLTLHTPKPLLELGNRPMLETLFYRLASAGVRRAVLSVFHQAPLLRRAVPKLRRFGLKVSVAQEPRPLGTGGAIRFAWPDKSQPCWVLNGDILSDFLPGPMAAAHRRSRAAASIWVVPVEDPAAFGVLEFNRLGKVTRFIEKPQPGETRSRHINAGLYLLEPSVLSLIPDGRPVSVEREVFPALLKAGLSAQAFTSARGTYWNDVGTPERFMGASLDILNRRLFRGRGPARELWGGLDKKGNLRAPGVKVARSALLRQCVLGRACQIGAGAELEASVVMAGCRIGAGAVIRGAVLGPDCQVGDHVSIDPGTVLGPGTRLSAYSRV